jgi:phosphopantetheinyl transferase (holo-ACP synthase)
MKRFCYAEFALKGINMKSINEFLSNLLNIPLSDDEDVNLTSAQRARLLSWGDQNGFKLDLKQLQGHFRISDLTGRHSSGSSAGNLDLFSPSARSKADAAKSRIGIDIQSISEMFPGSSEIDYSQIASIYSMYEIEFSKRSNSPKATLTGLFSLKESLLKAGVTQVNYVDLEITHTIEGAPLFYGYDVSISHSGDFVTSIAIKRN